MQDIKDESPAATDGSKATAKLVLEAGAAIYSRRPPQIRRLFKEDENENDDKHLGRANNPDDQRGPAAFRHTSW